MSVSPAETPSVNPIIPPPAEIGRVVKEWSDAKGKPLAMGAKLGITGVLAVVAVAGIAWSVLSPPHGQKPGGLHIGVLLGCLVVPLLAGVFLFQKRYLAYLGEQGAAVYSTRGELNPNAAQVIRFADISDVVVRTLSKQIGMRTWEMRFNDAAGVTRMRLTGNAQAIAGKISAGKMYWIAEGISKAWEAKAGRKVRSAD